MTAKEALGSRVIRTLPHATAALLQPHSSPFSKRLFRSRKNLFARTERNLVFPIATFFGLALELLKTNCTELVMQAGARQDFKTSVVSRIPRPWIDRGEKV